MEQIRVFEGGLNTDDSLETMEAGDYPYLLNGVKAKSANGKRGTIENMIGASPVLPYPSPLGPFSTCIGAIRDQKNNAWFLFFHEPDPAKHIIVRLGYSGPSSALHGTRSIGVIYNVLTWSGLNFDVNFLVTGGCVADNVLYFTDNKNGPRCINVTKYASGGVPTSEEDIDLLKRGGIYPPTFLKGNGPVDLNLTGKYGFQFAYQYEYEDNQFSVLSPYSELCPQNTRAETFNKIRVSMKTPPPTTDRTELIPKLVIKIRFAARFGSTSPTFFYIGELAATPWVSGAAYRVDDVVLSGGVWWQSKTAHTDAVAPVEGAIWTAQTIGIDFFNNTNGQVVPSIYLNQYHLVPRKAKCMELIKNRLWFGNYLEGYNTPKDAGLSVAINEQVINDGTGGTSVQVTAKDILKVRFTEYIWIAAPSIPVWQPTGNNQIVSGGSTVPFDGGTTEDIMLIDVTDLNDSPSPGLRSVSGTRVQWNAPLGCYVAMGPATVGGVTDPPFNDGTSEGDLVHSPVPEAFQDAKPYFVSATTVPKTIKKITGTNWRWNGTTLVWDNTGTSNAVMIPDVPFDGGTTFDAMTVDAVENLLPPHVLHGTEKQVIGPRVMWNAAGGFYQTTGESANFVGSLSPPSAAGPYDGYTVVGYNLIDFQLAKPYVGPAVPAVLTPYEGAKTFPSGSSYRIGYVLKDTDGRDLGGVITSNVLAINTPKSYFNIINATWTLPAIAPAGAIPAEAKSFAIVMSRNLTKNYFVEHRSVDLKYEKNDPDLDFYALYPNYSPDNDAILLDVTPIGKAGIGYQFVEGDRIILYPTVVNGNDNITDNATVWDLPIKSFNGTQIRLPNTNIGTFNAFAAKTTFEIYRPVKEPSEILYYEIGQSYPIVGGQFSVTTGIIKGDSVNTVRDVFTYNATDGYVTDSPPSSLFKAMSVDPVGAWDTDAGKPYVITTIGEVLKSNYFRHSATIINDTNVNGLCEHYFGDEGNVPQENGPINKLKSTSRQSTEGNVLLAISRNETASIYVDEQRMNLDTATSFMIQSNEVIGQIQTLKSNALGTIHPESVYDFNGNVYWWDAIHQKVVRYATNGLFPISDAKMIDHFEDAGSLNGISRVTMGYDPFYRVFNITHSNGVVGRKTVSWSEEQKRWISFHSYQPDWYVDLDNVMYTIKLGLFYAHTNTGAFNTFYDTNAVPAVYNTVLELNFNDTPAQPKYWSVASILLSKNFWTWVAGEQVIAPGRFKLDLETQFGQFTDITGERFDYDENMGYGTILKDSNSPGGILNGDDMFSHIATARLTIFGQVNDVYKQIHFVKLGYEVSKGHQL